MTQDELDLLHGFLDANLGETDFGRLQSLLRENADARRTLRALSTVDVKLHQLAAANPATLRLLAEPSVMPKSAQVVRRPTWLGWLQWRPLTAAAAGVMFGLLCASVAWAVASPRAMATASRLFALVDGSFENGHGRLASGFPSEFGKWKGDEAEVVAGEAKDGKQALRFVRAERESALPDHGAASCDVYQLVDLRSLKAENAPGEATLELSVQFCDAREAKGEPVKFICRLFVFGGSPEALPAEWPLTQKDALASGSGTTESTGGSPHSWRNISTKVLLPPLADFAVVHLLAHKPKTATGTEASFGEQFADDVRLTLKTQPTLPVRVAQR